jgi:uncharacterized protein (TIGR00730 family)
MPGDRRCVCFGSSRAAAASPAGQLARACGEQLALAGWTVLTGGYEGVMGQVSRGARDAGGRVIGVTTPIFTDRVPNEALHEEWSEPDYLARMVRLLREGDAFVGLPGGLGTLSEWIAAVCLASIGHLGGPLVLFRDPWAPVFEAVNALPESTPELARLVHWVDRPQELIEALEEVRRPATGR